MIRLFTLSRKICTSTIIFSEDICTESEISPRNCNDRNTNNCIDRNVLRSKRIEENRSMPPHPFNDNDDQNNQDTFLFNESYSLPDNIYQKNKTIFYSTNHMRMLVMTLCRLDLLIKMLYLIQLLTYPCLVS